MFVGWTLSVKNCCEQCMENTARGWGWVTNTAQGEAKCSTCHGCFTSQVNSALFDLLFCVGGYQCYSAVDLVGSQHNAVLQ